MLVEKLTRFKTRFRGIRWPLLQAMSDILFVRLFPVWQSMGFHITRNHFYSPIPDTRTLTDDLWQRESDLVGIDMNESNQVELLKQFSVRFKGEYDGLAVKGRSTANGFYANGTSFGPVDGEMLYCMIRHFKPMRVIEIGAGYSTYISARALLKNAEENGRSADLIAIEPYPNEDLRRGFPGLSRLINAKVETVAPAEFDKLQDNDILFIDSTHVLKIGNDVHYEYLEILPRLNRGVLVHIHDIFLPMEYPKEWVRERYVFWNEQYLLQAFLAFNDAFEVLWAGNYMQSRHPDKLEEAFDSYCRDRVRPGSFWIRRKA